MALKAGYNGIKTNLLNKLKALPFFNEIGTGLQVDENGALNVTGIDVTVVANPDDPATEDLAKLQVGDTVYEVNDNTKCYQTDDSTESAIVDADYIPFYDASASAPKKSTWSNFCNKVQAKLTAFVTWSANGVLGAKNIMPVKLDLLKVNNSSFIWTNNVAEKNGVTFTCIVNDAGYVTEIDVDTNGSQSSDNTFMTFLKYKEFTPPQTTWILSDSKVTANQSVYLYVNRKKGDSGTENYDVNTKNGDYQFTVDYSAYDQFVWGLAVLQNTTVDHVKLYPMLSIEGGTFQPYAMPNRELTEKGFFRGTQLSSSNDLDNIKIPGIYGVGAAPTHSPESLQYYTLIVDEYDLNQGQVTQIAIKTGTIYVRRYFNDGGTMRWDSWYKFTGTEITP